MFISIRRRVTPSKVWSPFAIAVFEKSSILLIIRPLCRFVVFLYTFRSTSSFERTVLYQMSSPTKEQNRQYPWLKGNCSKCIPVQPHFQFKKKTKNKKKTGCPFFTTESGALYWPPHQQARREGEARFVEKSFKETETRSTFRAISLFGNENSIH